MVSRALMTRALLILGPTASGKTALALRLAERLNGEIINADSMQVYRDLRVLTARPTPEEEAASPHHLFGTVDAAARFSVGEWLRAATPILAAIRARGRTPLIVGGTGLYFKALTEGLAAIPDPPPEAVDALRGELAAQGPEALHQRLLAIDPAAAARLEPRDGVRIVRALAVMQGTGRSILDWQGDAATPAVLGHADWAGFALTPDRGLLYGRIEARFAAMVSGGALEEVRALAARGLDPTLPAMKAHGAPWLMAHLDGRMSLEEAAALSARDTRRYAKRQFTWIAHQAAGFARLAEMDTEGQIASVLARLRE